jgi:hypothetical protein
VNTGRNYDRSAHQERAFFTVYAAKFRMLEFGMNPNKLNGLESGKIWLRQKYQVVRFPEIFAKLGIIKQNVTG